MSDIEVEGGLQVQIGALLKATTDAAAERRAAREREEAMIPLDHHVQGGGVAPSSGDLIFECGGPAMGRAWVLRRLAVGGNDPTQTAAGTAYFYMSSAGDEEQLLASGWFDYADTLPLVGWYTSRQVVLTHAQKIWCRIHAPTAGASYVVSGSVIDEIANERAAARYTL